MNNIDASTIEKALLCDRKWPEERYQSESTDLFFKYLFTNWNLITFVFSTEGTKIFFVNFTSNNAILF